MAIILSNCCPSGDCSGVTGPCCEPFRSCEVYYSVTTAWANVVIDENWVSMNGSDTSIYSIATPPSKTGETTFSIQQSASGPSLIVSVDGTNYTAPLGPWLSGYDGTYTGTLSGGLGSVSVTIRTPFPNVTSLYASTCGGGGILSRKGLCRFEGSFSGSWLTWDQGSNVQTISGTLSLVIGARRFGYFELPWYFLLRAEGNQGEYFTDTFGCGGRMGGTWQEAFSSEAIYNATGICSQYISNPLLFSNQSGDCSLTIS